MAGLAGVHRLVELVSSPSRIGVRRWRVGIPLLLVSLSGCFAAAPKSLQTPVEEGSYKDILARQARGEAFTEDFAEVPTLTAADEEGLGDRYLQQGEPGLALMRYQHALELDPSLQRARYKLGVVLLQKGRAADALGAFSQILVSEPENALGYLGQGQVYHQQERFQDAERVLRRATELSPDLWKAHETLGITLDRQQRHGEALAAYEAARSHRPSDPSLLNNIGVSHFLAGDYQRSAQVLEDAVRVSGGSARVYRNLARTYAKQHLYSEALDAYRKAGERGEAYNLVGEALLTDGKPRKAAACFEEAIRVTPQYYPEANDNLARARKADPRLRQASVSLGDPEAVRCP